MGGPRTFLVYFFGVHKAPWACHSTRAQIVQTSILRTAVARLNRVTSHGKNKTRRKLHNGGWHFGERGTLVIRAANVAGRRARNLTRTRYRARGPYSFGHCVEPTKSHRRTPMLIGQWRVHHHPERPCAGSVDRKRRRITVRCTDGETNEGIRMRRSCFDRFASPRFMGPVLFVPTVAATAKTSAGARNGYTRQ